MKRRRNKEKLGFTFSFLDIFFLVLLGLVFSVVLYFILETPDFLGEEKEHRVEVSAYLDSALAPALPMTGDVLYDQEGREIGEIRFMEAQIRGNSVFCKMECIVRGSDFAEGEKMHVETKTFVSDMWIYSAEEIEGGQG